MIERFRDGKAEHNDDSLAKLLQVSPNNVRHVVKPLLDMGFLEEKGGFFKVPMLYRDGLQITQGKRLRRWFWMAMKRSDSGKPGLYPVFLPYPSFDSR